MKYFNLFKQLDKEDDYMLWHQQPSNWIRGLVLLAVIFTCLFLGMCTDLTVKYLHKEDRVITVAKSNWTQRANMLHWEPVHYKDKWWPSHNPKAYNKSSYEDCEWVTECVRQDTLGNCTKTKEYEDCDTYYNYTIDEWVYKDHKVFKGSYPYIPTELKLNEGWKQEDKLSYTVTFYYNGEHTLKAYREHSPNSQITVSFWTWGNTPSHVVNTKP